MKILNPTQLREVETATIKIQDIELINLMERTANATLEWLRKQVEFKQSHFTIICGIGNNGGDGLALGRLLHENGAQIKIYLQQNNTYSLDNLENQKRLKDLKIPFELFDESTQLEIHPATILIDAIFGYGLNRPIEKEWHPIIQQINQSSNAVISIDVPSGLFCNQLRQETDAVVEADYTLTFQTPKLSLLLPENQKFVGQFAILNIDLEHSVIEQQETPFHYFLDYESRGFYFKRNKFSHKYNYGNTLIIGGSYGKMGAVLMAAKSVLRSGAGLVTAYVPKCGYEIIQTAFPEAMVITDFSEDKIIQFPQVDEFDTILIGSGMGIDEKTALALEQFLTETNLEDKKIIFDADGLNLLSKNPSLFKHLPKDTILTPHGGELKRLIGDWGNSIEKIEKAKKFSIDNQLIVVSKGAFTQIHLSSGEVYFNSSGNPGMATAGSGDVLAGILLAHRAKGFGAVETALFGTYLHGLAGDIAREQLGEESIIASDLIKYLPLAYKNIFG